ncbi:hypothetical protein Bca101_043066 [Brassica carinata]
MGSSTIVDYPEEIDGDQGVPIPEMMFAIGKEPVFVKSIIPNRHIVEATLGWEDEVVDVMKVDNLVKLICQNHSFTREMFKGGATKTDVERMCEKAKPQTYQKKKCKP